MKEENKSRIKLLASPEIPPDLSEAELYRAACIGTVTLLRESGDSDALAEAVRHASAPEIHERALLSLEYLALRDEGNGAEAVRQLFILAVTGADPKVGAFIRGQGLRDTDPGWNCAAMLLSGQKHQLLKQDPRLQDLSEFFISADPPLRLRLLSLGEKVLPNWACFMRFLDEPNGQNRAALLENYGGMPRGEKELIRFCVVPDQAVSSLPADIVLRYEDADARDLCVRHDLRPSDPASEALFYFLTGQWERYYAADSDYRRVRIAYEKNDPDLQRRLITAGRESGNNAWLRHVGGSVESLPHKGTLTDQRLLIDSLIEQKQWKGLWEMLPNVPLLCMPAVCDALDQAGFQPADPEEADFFKRLKANIAAAAGTSPIPAARTFRKENGTAVCLCCGGPYIAALFSDRRILVWDKRSPEAGPFLISSNRMMFRRAVISRDGKYLCADCGNDGIPVFALPSGQAVKTIPGTGNTLTGLYLQNDNRRLITLYQNGTGIVYSFPGGTELFRFDLGLKDCMRSAYDPQSNQICVIAFGGICRTYDIGARRITAEFGLGETPPAADKTLSRMVLSVIGQGNTLSSVNLLSGRFLLEKIPAGTESVRRLVSLNDGELYLLGNLAGQIRVFDPVSGTDLAVLSCGNRSPVIGICCDEENAALYGCTAAGALRSWDLKLFRDMTRVLPLRELPGVNRLDEYCRKYPEPGVKAAAEWMKTAAAWRRRFDIEVDFD